MIKYVIFDKTQELDLYNFTRAFTLKNYRYSISTAKFHITNDNNPNSINSTIKITKTNYIPLERPIVIDSVINRMCLDTFVLSILDTDTNVKNWLLNRGYTIMSLEDYTQYINS